MLVLFGKVAACAISAGWAKGEVDIRENVGATGDSLLARLAVPDTGGVTLDGVLAAEGAEVAGVLRDFDLLHLLTERGTITVGSLLVHVHGPLTLNWAQEYVECARGCVRTGYRIYR